MGKHSSIRDTQFISLVMWLALVTVAPPALADNAVKLRILVITTSEVGEDMGFAYIKPVLEEIGVPYDVLNAATQDLTPAVLASSSTGNSCKAGHRSR